MKLFRKSFALLMVLTLLMSMTISVLAVDVATADEFYEAYGNQETEFNLTDNIENVWFEAQEGTSYVIGSEDGYTLSNVGVLGAGNVEINTDITDGLYVGEDANVTVNGDITGMDNWYTDGDIPQGGPALSAHDNATVVVNGDATGGNAVAENGEQIALGGDGISVMGNANVTVNGDVVGGGADGAEENNLGTGMYSFENASAVVNGDVDGGLVADGESNAAVDGDVNGDLFAYGESNVAVDGDVNGYLVANGESNVAVDGDVNGYLVADGESNVAVDGDVNGDLFALYENNVVVDGDVNGGLNALGDSKVSVGGDVNGTDGSPDSVDFSDPMDYSDGLQAISAGENAVVEVAGNVSGGDGYGTYGYGGTGVDAYDNATVTVGGNVTGGDVTADPEIEAAQNEWTDESGETYTETLGSVAGSAVQVSGGASVTVGGNVAGGSTNGDAGNAGNGAFVDAANGAEDAATLTVTGAVTAGKAENGGDGIGLGVIVQEGGIAPDVTVGSYDTAFGVVVDMENGTAEEMTEEDFGSVVTVTGTPGEVEKPSLESHWGYLLAAIGQAKPGDEITTEIGARKYIPSIVIEAVRDADVKLTIKWSGGDDLVITKDFTAELSEYILLTDLAEMLKK